MKTTSAFKGAPRRTRRLTRSFITRSLHGHPKSRNQGQAGQRAVRRNDVAAAIATIDDLVAQRPDDVTSILLRLTMLGQMGEYDEGEHGHETALLRHGGAAKLWVGYANLLKTAGKITESATAYCRALMLKPSPAEAWSGLADLTSGMLDQADVAGMRSFSGAAADRHAQRPRMAALSPVAGAAIPGTRAACTLSGSGDHAGPAQFRVNSGNDPA